MPDLDATDLDILQLLLEDGRRSFREIADEVDLSPPSVSNRVERLRELGVVRRFTVEVDRTKLSGADETLLFIESTPDEAAAVLDAVKGVDGVEHAFRTVEARIVAKAVLSPSEVHDLFRETLDDEQVREYRIDPVLDSVWRPQLGAGGFDLECMVCGNTITSDGETVQLDTGDTYHVCCPVCAEKVMDEHDRLAEGAHSEEQD
ncbi:Lrp/AsnC family transcriptional regulator [Haloarchaeobius sp. TZWWS8]|uniref:Lrp/AsnC family transcriptional regulator n=1 Tax=Haloarchaeobius sp. TZWWS8 TaxID=3446121 RepID=UPI003EB79146